MIRKALIKRPFEPQLRCCSTSFPGAWNLKKKKKKPKNSHNSSCGAHPVLQNKPKSMEVGYWCDICPVEEASFTPPGANDEKFVICNHK